MGTNETQEQSGTSALARRIKKHVVGPEHHFAVIAPSELAPICLGEIAGAGIAGGAITDAGIEFTGKLTDAYNCHLLLRTASRVLCRIAPFRAGAAEELFFKTSRIPWELWLNPEIPLSVEAYVEYSRISHEGKAAEIVLDCILKAFRERTGTRGYGSAAERGSFPEDSGRKQRVLVHLVENHCLISLDMSGKHLHERGYRVEHTGAPLRETLAAAILLKSGWKGDEPLVDGMCGSGTFPIEAALIARGIAPGIGRDFLFQAWPSFRKESWDYLCRKAMAAETGKAPEPIVGIDLDEDAVRVSERNAVRAGVGDDIEWRRMDFFDFDPGKSALKRGLLVLNPPYGKRLAGGGGELYGQIGLHLRRSFKGWKYAVLAGSRSDAAAMGMKTMRAWPIRHGGISITVAMGVVPGS